MTIMINDDLKGCDPRKLPCCSSRGAHWKKGHKKVCLFVKISFNTIDMSVCLSIVVFIFCVFVCLSKCIATSMN